MDPRLRDIEGIDELFTVAPEDFVKTRHALTKALKGSGDPDAATLVGSLKRPTGPVWAINQLAREHPDDIERFLEIQSSLADLGGGRRLSELTSERRKVVGRLTQLAAKLLKRDGQTATTQILQRIGGTLLAADDPDEQEAIRHGVLTRELTISGFGGTAIAETAPTGEAPDVVEESSRRAAAALEAEASQAAERADRLAEEAARLLQEADAASAEAREARKRADRLVKEAKAAHSKLERS